jgi:putative intracellular protease/amidase
MGDKILFIVTSNDKLGSSEINTGFHLAELTIPYLMFVKAGIDVDIASPKGGAAPIDPKSYDLDYEVNKWFVDNAESRKKIEGTIALHQVNANQYQGIYFPGGHGTMWDFPDNPIIESIVGHVYEAGGFIGAVCHGPAALVDLRLPNGEYLVDGKKITCFSNAEEKAVQKDQYMPFSLEDKLVEQGGDFSAAKLFEHHVMSDSRLVTGQNPASAQGIAQEMIRQLQTKKPKP